MCNLINLFQLRRKSSGFKNPQILYTLVQNTKLALVTQSMQFPWALTINKVTCKEQEEKQVIYNGSPIGQISWHASGTLHCSSDANQPQTWLQLSQTCSWFVFPEHCRAAGTLW